MNEYFYKTSSSVCKLLFLSSLIWLFTRPIELAAQSKPAALKQSAAKPKSSKPSGETPTSGTVQKASSKPAVKTPASKPPTTGQSSTSKPVPTKTTSPAQSTPDTPKKTATSPTGSYQAVESTKASTPHIVQKKKSYGLGFNKNDKLLNVGVGLSSYYYGTPIGLSFEAGIHKDISIGGQLDYNSGRYNDYYYSSSRWGYRAYYLGFRGSYHFNRLLKIKTKNLDLYAGVGLGYQSFRWNDRSYGYGYDYRSGLFYNYFIGGKYYFGPKVGAFVELGYTGLSSSRVGIAFKF